MTSTTNRTAYTAQTPDGTSFGSDNILLTPLDGSGPHAGPGISALPEHLPISRVQILLEPARTTWRLLSSKWKALYKNNIGLLLLGASTAFGSMTSALVKKLNSVDPPVPMLELILIRMAMTWVCCIVYMWLTEVPDPLLGPKGIRLLLMLRGFCGFTKISGSYFSLQYLSVSDATVLQFLAPMCTGVVCTLVLKEHFTCNQAFASLFSLFGVVLIARPSVLFSHAANTPTTALLDPLVLDGRADPTGVTPAQRLSAIGFAMLGVVGATVAYTSIRAIGKRAHPLHNVAALSTQCVVMSSLFMLVLRIPAVIPTRMDWIGMLVALCFCGFMSQILLTMGLQRETAGRGTMALYVQIIFATFYDFFFFHLTPNILSVIGTFIIISSAVYVAMLKEDSGLHKQTQNLVGSPDDAILEEGLLGQQEGADDVNEDMNGNAIDHEDPLAPDEVHGQDNSKVPFEPIN